MSQSDGPKGFDKFFKPPKSTDAAPKQQQSNEKSSENSAESTSKPPTSKPSSSSSKSPPDWNLGMFSPTPSSKGSQGQGRPIPPGTDQNPDQNKMIFYAAMGFVAFVGALMYFELGYKEISWKDFINK